MRSSDWNVACAGGQSQRAMEKYALTGSVSAQSKEAGTHQIETRCLRCCLPQLFIRVQMDVREMGYRYWRCFRRTSAHVSIVYPGRRILHARTGRYRAAWPSASAWWPSRAAAFGSSAASARAVASPSTCACRAPRRVRPRTQVTAPVTNLCCGRRVLFAEDNLLSQEILFEMLENLGCELDVASDGIDAVACAEARFYDLILMDLQMPRMDGLTARAPSARCAAIARHPSSR